MYHVSAFLTLICSAIESEIYMSDISCWNIPFFIYSHAQHLVSLS